MDEIKLKGRLISYIGQGMLSEPFGEAEIIISPEELASQLTFEEAFNILYHSPNKKDLPQPKQEFCTGHTNYVTVSGTGIAGIKCAICHLPLPPKPEKIERLNETETLTLSILQLNSFINLWLYKTRIEIEQLCKGNDTLKDDILKSQLSTPLKAWSKIKDNLNENL